MPEPTAVSVTAWLDQLDVAHRNGVTDVQVNALPQLTAAVRAVLAVVEFVDDCADGRSPLPAAAYRDIAARIRTALGSVAA